MVDLSVIAKKLRQHALKMVYNANASHIGGCLSIAEILTVLYFDTMAIFPDRPKTQDRDRFIISKGHCTAILYAALAERGFFPTSHLDLYGKDGSNLHTHASHYVPGVEFSTGSLGHGLPIGCGTALAAMKRGEKWRTFVLISDGELDEGSNWEAILFAGHHRLCNLIAIIDFNKIQSLGRTSQVLDLEPLGDKFRAFGWSPCEIDGHDTEAIRLALRRQSEDGMRPKVVIAHTTKGKGVDFMEDSLQYHYSPPRSKLELEAAISQVVSKGN